MTYALPLHALRAFEAAARHLNFTLAARELNVQQPAISRQIAELEAALGVAVFERRKPRLRLTEEGLRLQSAVVASFGGIRDAMADIRSPTRGRPLVVNLSVAFATFWMLPRLHEFRRRYPAVDVELVTRDRYYDHRFDDADVLIRFSQDARRRPEDRLVLSERLFPVAAPAAASPALADPRALAGARLLYLHARDENHAHDWHRLLATAGQTPAPASSSARYSSYVVYMQAVLSGEGIGLGWGGLIDGLLAEGRLVRLGTIELATDRGYYCAVMPAALERPEAAAFVDWILEASAAERGA